jgi:predicted GIY-YIG superfamily endonuclease
MDKSALKNAYKRSKRPMGVYIISNSQDNTIFIGYSTDLPAKFNRHKSELKFGGHRNKELQNLWKSLGENALTFKILDELDHKEEIQNPEKELQLLTEMWVSKLEKEGFTVITL